MNKIICVNRQFGSGGHEISVKTGERLGLPVYDKELLSLACRHGEVREQTLSYADEKPTNPYLFQAVYEGNSHVTRGMPTSEVLFQLQSHEIMRLAQEEPCIFVGRCANWVLRDEPGVALLRVYVSASLDDRVERKMRQENLSRSAALKQVKKMDRQRRSYYEGFTGLLWDSPKQYDLMLNTSELGIDGAVDLVATQYKALPE